MAIDKAFREAKIEIAFPQRDVNIRHINIDPLLPALGRQPEATKPRDAAE